MRPDRTPAGAHGVSGGVAVTPVPVGGGPAVAGPFRRGTHRDV
jgi:hypothetical protein